MRIMGFRLMLFAGAFALYAVANDEQRLLTGAGIFAAIGLLIWMFAKK